MFQIKKNDSKSFFKRQSSTYLKINKIDSLEKINISINFLVNYKFKSLKKCKPPPVGIEPTTYGLEVHRAIRCAMGAYINFLYNKLLNNQ